MRVLTASPGPPTPTSTSIAGRDFEKEIVVKVNVPEVARAELMRPSWKREHVALGTNTDPYQWVEGRYQLMPGIWEAHAGLGHAVVGAHEVAAAAARHRAVQADPRGRRVRREPLDPDARREGLARERAAHAAPAQADRGGRRAEPRRHPNRDPDRAADARASTTIPSRSRRSSSCAARRARRASAASRCTCAARCGTSSSSGCARTGPISCRATRSSTRAARTSGRPSESGSPRCSDAARGAAPGPVLRNPGREARTRSPCPSGDRRPAGADEAVLRRGVRS